LPELALIERFQQIAMKRDESISDSFFTFCSEFGAIRCDAYDIFVTMARCGERG
jgi:hypothetical protein